MIASQILTGGQRGGKKRLKSTKNCQVRRIALDADSLALVATLWQEYNERMAQQTQVWDRWQA